MLSSAGCPAPRCLPGVKDLEQEKTEIDRQMRELKATVDASAIPETRLREIIDEISGDNPARECRAAGYRLPC